MAQQTIGIGTTANDGTGDPLRTAFDKANDNFTELYAAIAALQAVESYARLPSDYALTSTTTSQKLFNTSTNGAVTLDLGAYDFRCKLWITGMDGTSGNGVFNLLGAGTAVLDEQIAAAIGRDAADVTAAAAMVGNWALASNSFVTATVQANIGTALAVLIEGSFKVTTAGTLIPSFALANAASATLKKGSEITFWAKGTGNTKGSWS